MGIPESPEVIKQRIATDHRVVDHLSLVMSLGPAFVNPEDEFRIVSELSSQYKVGIQLISEACDMTRAKIGQGIIDGTIEAF